MPLFIVATPIGNLSDISERALETLRSADLIVAEDTRTTRKLLNRYDIQTQLKSMHQHSSTEEISSIVQELALGRTVAMVSDAGTPGVSDPGGELIGAVVNRNHELRLPAGQAGITNCELIQILPIPGPSAVASIMSVADFLIEPSLFVGFLPKKKGRSTLLATVKTASTKHGIHSIVLYESPERIGRTLTDLAATFGDTTHVVIGRELTKQFEEVWYGTATDAKDYFMKPRGEFTLLVRTVGER